MSRRKIVAIMASAVNSVTDLRSNTEYVLQELQPIHFWRCDEESGGLYDEITGLTGTATSGVSYKQPKLVNNEPPESYSVGILGQLQNRAHFNLGTTLPVIATGEFTVAMTIKGTLQSGRSQLVLTSGGASTIDKGIKVYLQNGNLRVDSTRGVDESVITLSKELGYGVKELTLLITRRSGTFEVYLDGVSIGTSGAGDEFFTEGEANYSIGNPTVVHTAYRDNFTVDNIAVSDFGVTSQKANEWHNNVMKQYQAP